MMMIYWLGMFIASFIAVSLILLPAYAPVRQHHERYTHLKRH